MDLFSTNSLMGLVQYLKVTPSFLVNKFFPMEQTHTTEEIHFDVVDRKRRLAPFVSPVVEGKPMASRGFTTKTFKPAYVKPKFAYDPNRALKRVAGEQIAGALTPEQRMQQILMQDLEDIVAMLNARLEVMASEALRAGQITVSGDLYPETVVSFGRNANLTVTLTGGNRWGQAGVNPLTTLATWSDLLVQYSGQPGLNVVMDIDAWKTFKANSDVLAQLTLFRQLGQMPSLNPAAPIQDGVQYVGTIETFNLWVYNGYYETDAGVTTPILPSGTVIMTIPSIEGVQAFGAIKDHDALVATRLFPKSWVDQDPSVRWLMGQSAPLIVPTLVNGTLCATVL